VIGVLVYVLYGYQHSGLRAANGAAAAPAATR
jgi:hypothetical protein